MHAELNNVQQTNIIDTDEATLTLIEKKYTWALHTPWDSISDTTLVVSGLTYFHNRGIKIA